MTNTNTATVPTTPNNEQQQAIERWALDQPSTLSRAVREGYPYAAGVASIVTQALVALGAESQKKAGLQAPREPSFTNEVPKGGDRDTPDDRSFAMLDDVRTQLRNFHAQPWCPPHTEFELLRIRRCTPGTTDKPKPPYTAVVLVVRNPVFGKRVVVIPTE